MTEPTTYLVARLHQALLDDERLHEQSIEIVILDGARLELRGEVATPERRAAALALARQLAPDVDIVDDVCVSGLSAAAEPESL